MVEIPRKGTVLSLGVRDLGLEVGRTNNECQHQLFYYLNSFCQRGCWYPQSAPLGRAPTVVERGIKNQTPRQGDQPDILHLVKTNGGT